MDERGLFVAEAIRADSSMSELCRAFGVSRKTGYKWLQRYADEGLAGLADRSHATHACPHRLDAATAERILGVRAAHPSWGSRKIRAWLEDRHPQQHWPAASTIGALLSREGLTAPRRKRARAPASAPLSHALAANDVWTVDFKGWFLTGDGRRCNPLTLADAASRYLLRCQALARTDAAAVWPIFDAAFREFGLPKAVRSDNGAPFASVGAGGLSPLSVKLIKAGVALERIEPGKPQQNGRHERLHLTLARETAQPPKAHRRAQQRAFDAFRLLYNEERPHEALGQKPPARFYALSARRYSGRLRQPEYGDCDVRRVRDNGEIKWRGQPVYVSQTLRGEPLAVEEVGDGRWQLRYGPVLLGAIDRHGALIRPKAMRRRPR